MNIQAHNNTGYLIERMKLFMKENEKSINYAGAEDTFADLQGELDNLKDDWEEADEEYQEADSV